MFNFITGVIAGAVSMLFVMGLVNAGKPTESELQAERNHTDVWKREAKEWETANVRLHDELRNATHMAQYWRARCLNEHCDFHAACDGNGVYPTNDDGPTHEEKLVSDIMDAVAVAEKDIAFDKVEVIST